MLRTVPTQQGVCGPDDEALGLGASEVTSWSRMGEGAPSPNTSIHGWQSWLRSQPLGRAALRTGGRPAMRVPAALRAPLPLAVGHGEEDRALESGRSRIPASALPGCVTSGRSLYLSEPPLPSP